MGSTFQVSLRQSGLIGAWFTNTPIDEKFQLTALIPESCCDSCMTTPMTRGLRRVEEHKSSDMEMVDSACWAICSTRISSMSTSIWVEARSFLRAGMESELEVISASRNFKRKKHYSNSY